MANNCRCIAETQLSCGKCAICGRLGHSVHFMRGRVGVCQFHRQRLGSFSAKSVRSALHRSKYDVMKTIYALLRQSPAAADRYYEDLERRVVRELARPREEEDDEYLLEDVRRRVRAPHEPFVFVVLSKNIL